METSRLSVNRWTIARVLGALSLLLVVASIGGQLWRFLIGEKHLRVLVNVVSLDRERSLPTFFSVLLLVLASLLLALIAVLVGKLKQPDLSKWALLSFGFLFMAFDENYAVHERLILPVRALLGDEDLGIFYFAWVVPGILLVLALGAFFLRFLWRLPAATRLTIIRAATLYLGGAIGVEMIGGAYFKMRGDDLTYAMITTVEESLEIAGLIVFLYALLGYIADRYGEVSFRFVRVHEGRHH